MKVLSAVTLSTWVLQTVVEVLVPGPSGAWECMQGPEFSGYQAARASSVAGPWIQGHREFRFENAAPCERSLIPDSESPAELGFQGFASYQAHIGLTDTCAETQCSLFGCLQCLPLSWSVRHLERGSMPWGPLSPFSYHSCQLCCQSTPGVLWGELL